LAASTLLHPVQAGSASLLMFKANLGPLYLRDAVTLTSKNSCQYCLCSANTTDFTVPRMSQ